MSSPAKRRVTFNQVSSVPNSVTRTKHSNYAEHTHTASLSRRRDTLAGTLRFLPPKPRFYELKPSKEHPGLRARGHYKDIPANGGAYSARISHPTVNEKPLKDGRNAFNTYVEHLRRSRIQRQSYSLNRSFASMRTMHDITSASPYMSTATRMRGAERTRFKLDLRSYPHLGAVFGYADVAPMQHPPSYTAESFKAMENSARQSSRSTNAYTPRYTHPRKQGQAQSDEEENIQLQGSAGLLGAFAQVVKGMATDAIRKPKAVQEKQVKEVIQSAMLELDSPKKPEVSVCTICLVNEANMKFYPCNHEAVCEQCYEMHAKRRGRGKFCPLCRGVIYTVEKAGVPYNLPKETSTALLMSQSLLPYMGIKSIKLREPREPFVIKEPRAEAPRVFATLPQMNLGI